MIQIETKITWSGTEEQLQLLLQENGFTGIKPSYDENGQPLVDEETGEPITEEMTKGEYLDYLIKEGSRFGGGIMPMIRGTTASLQEKFGSLNYNSKTMNDAMEQLIQVNTTITEE